MLAIVLDWKAYPTTAGQNYLRLLGHMTSLTYVCQAPSPKTARVTSSGVHTNASSSRHVNLGTSTNLDLSGLVDRTFKCLGRIPFAPPQPVFTLACTNICFCPLLGGTPRVSADTRFMVCPCFDSSCKCQRTERHLASLLSFPSLYQWKKFARTYRQDSGHVLC